MRPLLSKTTYMYGMQCHKRFYLNRFHKELANPEEVQTQAIFQTGTNVGELAQQLFPGGVNAQGEEEWHSEKTVKRTAELLHKHSIIYEAAFMFNEVLCAVDILVQKGNKFYAYEVKSTNSVKEQHLEDAALQYYILSNCGLNLQDFSIIHFDKEYIRIGEIEVAKLFTATSVLEAVEALRQSSGTTLRQSSGTTLRQSSFRPTQAIVYSQAFEGSYSIKKVLPVMVPELSYNSLNIQEGGTASFMYGQLGLLEPIARERLREDLLAYCHLDTLAMVKIWERVEGMGL